MSASRYGRSPAGARLWSPPSSTHHHESETTVSRPPLPRRPIIWRNALFLTVFPVIAVAATVAYGMTVGIGWAEVGAAVVLWWLTGLGITAGYHRLFSHCGYRAPAPLRLVYAALGAAACQNSAIAWSSDHRYHHSETDTDGDPYDATRGFWYSHMGWIFFEGAQGNDYTNVPDLRRDPILAWQHEHYLAVAVATNLILAGLATLIGGHLLGMLVVAVLLRIVVVQHLTFLINSAAHVWGTQPWSKGTSSRDNWFLSLFTLGEGYHNYHHSFQADYRNGPRWYNCDPTKWLIWCLSRVGLASDLHRAPVDIVLTTRFEESCRSLATRMEAWGAHSAEEWSAMLENKREELLSRRDQFLEGLRGGKTALRDQLLATQAKAELRLVELKALRAAHRDGQRRAASAATRELRRATERELAHLRRAIRHAQRSIRATLRGWERLARDYSAGLPPAPAPA